MNPAGRAREHAKARADLWGAEASALRPHSTFKARRAELQGLGLAQTLAGLEPPLREHSSRFHGDCGQAMIYAYLFPRRHGQCSWRGPGNARAASRAPRGPPQPRWPESEAQAGPVGAGAGRVGAGQIRFLRFSKTLHY